MSRVFDSIVHDHDLRLVVVAAVICYLAAFTAFAAFAQARAGRSRTALWIALAGLLTGVGVWATHFVAMLAYRPHILVGYDFWTTVLSFVAAVLISGGAWALALDRRPFAAPLAGAAIGVGIGVMHYIGMAAMDMAGGILWDWQLVVASLLLGPVLAMAALVANHRQPERVPWIPAGLLALGVCALHFTGMAAATLHHDPLAKLPHGLIDGPALAMVVTAAALLIFAIAFGLLLFDRGIARTQLLEARKRAALADEILRAAAERDRLLVELKRQADISSATLNNMVQGLSMFDRENRLISFNRRFAELYGLPAELLEEGISHDSIFEHLLANCTLQGTLAYYQAEARHAGVRASHTEIALTSGRIVDVRRQPLQHGGWIATHEDVTEIRQASRRIAYLAAHDPLTGLANRADFADRLKAATQTVGSGPGFALLTIDLDRFKEVNDTLGHPVGDQILKQAAARLRALVGNTDFITRIGGDEFAVVQMDVAEPAAAAALAAAIVERMADPFRFDGHTIAIGASVGISLAPKHGTDGDELLKLSDLALYRAKADSRGAYRFFEPGMDLPLRRRRELEAELRLAIDDGQFAVHYQPLLDLAEGKIHCFEALLRWNHPKRGMIQPRDFIAIAEESGLIIPIGEWVLRQACRDAAGWPDGVRVAVNLSAAQFKRGDLLAMTRSALAAAGLDPERLELEVTETVLLHDEEWVRSILGQLRAMGIRIAMDDFGTGYSSLSYLRTFPFTKIKIDQSFIADLGGNSDSLAIVQSIVHLADKLGLATVAEGVETAEQMAIVLAEGCSEAQGFLISPPVPAEQVPGLINLDSSLAVRIRKSAASPRRLRA